MGRNRRETDNPPDRGDLLTGDAGACARFIGRVSRRRAQEEQLDRESTQIVHGRCRGQLLRGAATRLDQANEIRPLRSPNSSVVGTGSRVGRLVHGEQAYASSAGPAASAALTSSLVVADGRSPTAASARATMRAIAAASPVQAAYQSPSTSITP